MSFLIRQTLIYAVPLMIVALAGIFAERSGIINLALEGIMIFGAFVGVLFVRLVQQWGWFDAAKAAGDWMSLQGFVFLAMLVAAALPGYIFLMLLTMGMAPYWQRAIPILAGMLLVLLILLAAGLRKKKWFRYVLAICGVVLVGLVMLATFILAALVFKGAL